MELDAGVSYKEWEELLSRSSSNSVFQTPQMLHVYNSTEGYKAILATYRGAAGDLQGLLLGANIHPRVRFPLSLVSWSMSKGGPIVSASSDDPTMANLLLDFEKMARTQGSLYSRLYRSPGQEALRVENLKGRWAFENAFDYTLDLTASIEVLWSHLDKSRRKNLKRAEQTGLSLKLMNNLDGLETLKQLYAILAERAGLIPYPPSLFDAVYQSLVQSGCASIFVCEASGRRVAARCTLHHLGTATDWIAGATDDAAAQNANEFLVWEAIKFCKERGLRMFNFGGAGTGSNIPGIAEFKRRFGGKLVNPGRYRCVHRPVLWGFAQSVDRIRRGWA